jgi:hypothetical protein
MDKFEKLKANLLLNLDEWKDLLLTSARYEFEKRIQKSAVLSPVVTSAEVFIEMVVRVSRTGFASRIKVGRLLVRMFGAMVNQNSKAFEAAIKDLMDLGREL